ncbi:MAG: ArsR family transcriptional regulator [Metallosphaera yellowstonensis]|jgi:hypothetical protein|uniref:Putative transcriptional regulator n=1 Tax=Metallosphaera yellowstonensis MK1 TaxID=671065 RepID=H2C7C9_9CREN|nr:ArsR family transcriptional regulator [Metallosphaera yellowstonensis]EHP68055.1 putative transcriptional regulator [Metallosphaera yellowstonensis MK1]
MKISQLMILGLLLEGELSVSEIGEYTGLDERELKRELKELLKDGLVEEKAVLGGDLILAITQRGTEVLLENYQVLKRFLQNLEDTLCLQFSC